MSVSNIMARAALSPLLPTKDPKVSSKVDEFDEMEGMSEREGVEDRGKSDEVD
jgi:hypothetical protein